MGKASENSCLSPQFGATQQSCLDWHIEDSARKGSLFFLLHSRRTQLPCSAQSSKAAPNRNHDERSMSSLTPPPTCQEGKELCGAHARDVGEELPLDRYSRAHPFYHAELRGPPDYAVAGARHFPPPSLACLISRLDIFAPAVHFSWRNKTRHVPGGIHTP